MPVSPCPRFAQSHVRVVLQALLLQIRIRSAPARARCFIPSALTSNPIARRGQSRAVPHVQGALTHHPKQCWPIVLRGDKQSRSSRFTPTLVTLGTDSERGRTEYAGSPREDGGCRHPHPSGRDGITEFEFLGPFILALPPAGRTVNKVPSQKATVSRWTQRRCRCLRHSLSTRHLEGC